MNEATVDPNHTILISAADHKKNTESDNEKNMDRLLKDLSNEHWWYKLAQCYHFKSKTNIDELVNMMNEINVESNKPIQLFNPTKVEMLSDKLWDISSKQSESLCKNCVFIVIPLFYEQFNISISVKQPSLHYCAIECFVSILKRINCKLNVTKYCYRNSNLWYWTFIYFSMLVMLLDSVTKLDKCNREYIDRMVHSLSTCMFIIMSNIKLMTRKHWKIAIIKFKFINLLLDCVTIKLELFYKDTELEFMDFFEVSKFLIVYSLNQYRKFNKTFKWIDTRVLNFIHYINSKVEIPDYDISCDIYRQYSIQMSRKIRSAIGFFESLGYMMNEKLEMYWKRRKIKQVCLFAKCNITKHKLSHKKFVKCSKCLAAVYCSKRCAKLDWKNGYHKEYCDAYAQISKNCTQVGKKWIEYVHNDFNISRQFFTCTSHKKA
eukprot:56377_1